MANSAWRILVLAHKKNNGTAWDRVAIVNSITFAGTILGLIMFNIFYYLK